MSFFHGQQGTLHRSPPVVDKAYDCCMSEHGQMPPPAQSLVAGDDWIPDYLGEFVYQFTEPDYTQQDSSTSQKEGDTHMNADVEEELPRLRRAPTASAHPDWMVQERVHEFIDEHVAEFNDEMRDLNVREDQQMLYRRQQQRQPLQSLQKQPGQQFTLPYRSGTHKTHHLRIDRSLTETTFRMATMTMRPRMVRSSDLVESIRHRFRYEEAAEGGMGGEGAKVRRMAWFQAMLASGIDWANASNEYTQEFGVDFEEDMQGYEFDGVVW